LTWYIMKFTAILAIICGLTALVAGCGRQSIVNSRVIGGHDARPNSWPWQIVLKENGRPGCGGSIISPNWIVTASHCVVDSRSGRTKSAYSFSVSAGKHDLRYRERYEQTVQASQVISHPGFNFRTFQSDVALIRLRTPLVFNQAVSPICLPSRPQNAGAQCYISGWGRNSRRARGMHHTLQQARMPIVSQHVCSYHMRRVASIPITGTNLCSGHGDTRLSGCQGDSGGPFVCNNGQRWELHGAVSWGSSDCSSKPNEYTVYANIYNLKSWISRHTGIY